MFRRPELLVAASVPVLLLAGVLSWHRDVLCTRSGCGTIAASALTGSPVWAAVLVGALALAGAWVLLLPTRGQVPLAVAALTGVAGVVSAAIVVVSLDALVFNHAGFFGFDLPVTETFPVLAVHPGPGLLLGLAGLLLQAVGGWTSVRHRTALLTPPRRHPAPLPAQPVPPVPPSSVPPSSVPPSSVPPSSVPPSSVPPSSVPPSSVSPSSVPPVPPSSVPPSVPLVVRAAGPPARPRRRRPCRRPSPGRPRPRPRPRPRLRGPRPSRRPSRRAGRGRRWRSGRGRRRRGGTVGEPDA